MTRLLRWITSKLWRRIPPNEPAEDPLFTVAVWQRAVAAGLTREGYAEYLHNRGRK